MRIKLGSGIYQSLIFILIVIFSFLIIYQAFYYSNRDGGTDLRNRVIGARLLHYGESPYFYKWRPKDGEILLDPNDDPNRLVNGNTSTPAVLTLMYPFCQLRYPTIRFVWTLIQLLLAAASVYLMILRVPKIDRLYIAAMVLFGLLLSSQFLLHLERGQIIIFFVFLFSLMYYLYTSKWNYGSFVSGIIGGLLIYLRPFSIFVALVFIGKRKAKWIFGYGVGILLGLVIYVLPFQRAWSEYFHAMDEYGNEYLNKGHRQVSANYEIPRVIEGSSNLSLVSNFPGNSLYTMNILMTALGIRYNKLLSFILLGTGFFIIVGYLMKSRRHFDAEELFLFSFLCYMIPEIFLLNWRGPYNLLEWIFPLFLIFRKIKVIEIRFVLVIVGLCLLRGLPFYFPTEMLIGELILFFIILSIIYNQPAKKSIGEIVEKSTL